MGFPGQLISTNNQTQEEHGGKRQHYFKFELRVVICKRAEQELEMKSEARKFFD